MSGNRRCGRAAVSASTSVATWRSSSQYRSKYSRSSSRCNTAGERSSGLAATAASHSPAPAMAGPRCRPAPAPPRVPRTPTRRAPHAPRTRSPARPARRAPCPEPSTVGRQGHRMLRWPRFVEHPQRSGGAGTEPPVRGVGHLDGHVATRGPSSRSDTAVTSAVGGRQLNTPAGDRRRWRSAAHAADEQIQHATEVALWLVPGLSPPQEPMQHNAVQQRLQWIVGMQHRLGHPLTVVVGGRQQAIGLPSQLVL